MTRRNSRNRHSHRRQKMNTNPVNISIIQPQEPKAKETSEETVSKTERKKRYIDELKAQLDSSSALNRSLGLTFLAVLLYLLITVANVSDYMLLVGNSSVELPLVNIHIPVLAFLTIPLFWY